MNNTNTHPTESNAIYQPFFDAYCKGNILDNFLYNIKYLIEQMENAPLISWKGKTIIEIKFCYLDTGKIIAESSNWISRSTKSLCSWDNARHFDNFSKMFSITKEEIIKDRNNIPSLKDLQSLKNYLERFKKIIPFFQNQYEKEKKEDHVDQIFRSKLTFDRISEILTTRRETFLKQGIYKIIFKKAEQLKEEAIQSALEKKYNSNSFEIVNFKSQALVLAHNLLKICSIKEFLDPQKDKTNLNALESKLISLFQFFFEKENNWDEESKALFISYVILRMVKEDMPDCIVSSFSSFIKQDFPKFVHIAIITFDEWTQGK